MDIQKLKKAGKIFYYACSTARLVHKSGLFDSLYYQQQLGREKLPAIVALFHYLLIGYRQRISPSPYLCPEYYYSQITFPETRRVEPIQHYVTEGWQNGVNPNPFFETNRIKEIYLPQRGRYSNPLLFYLVCCNDIRVSPSTYIDISYYQTKYEQVRNSDLSPWSHYLYFGEKDRLCPSPKLENWFELAWFKDHKTRFFNHENGVLYSGLVTGLIEHFSQVPVLDPLYILQQIGSDNAAPARLFEWVDTMVTDMKKPSSWFDPAYYLTSNKLTGSAFDAVKHYISTGVFQRFYPNPEVEKLKKKPLLSIVVPVYNVKESFLNRCIRSVLYQSYPHWELCLADDASPDSRVREVLADWQEKDPRIKVVLLQENKGISGATNAAAEIASGEFISFLDNDDELLPEALFEVVQAINTSQADVVYSDEQLIDHDGRLVHVFHKPGFNRELLFSHNYITHFVTARTALFREVGGLSADRNGAQDFDFLLKITERTQRIHHIAKSLYRWRATETSTTINHESKAYADEAGRKAVEDALARRHINGAVTGADWKFYYQVKREIQQGQTVSILVDGRSIPNVAELLDILRRILHRSVSEIVVLVDHHDIEVQSSNIRVMRIDKREGLLVQYNRIMEQAEGRHILFIHGALLSEEMAPDWIDSMLEQSQEPSVGVVSAQIITENHGVNHLPDLSCTESQYFAKYLQLASIHMNGLQWSQEILAANFDCCMVKKELLSQLGGFDEKCHSLKYAGLAFSLDVSQTGIPNIYTAFARVVELPRYKDAMEKEQHQKDMKKLKRQYPIADMLIPQFINPCLLEENNINLDDFYEWCC